MSRTAGMTAAAIAWAVIAVLFSLGTSAVALAETRVALVIGNGAYSATAALPNPPNDARDVAAALRSTGFDVVEAIDADRRGMDGALRDFTEKLAAADVALLFYAGHGLQVGGQNYLVPTDARLTRERDLDFEAVRVDFVLRQMEIDREGKTSIVILDACRDNPLARNLARTMGTRSASVGRGLAPAATGVGTFIAFATQPGNVALDGDGRNSPFTQALVRHMRSAGQNLPATMVAVRKDVIATTGGKQVPWDHSALTGEFYFVPGAAAGGPVAAPAPASGGADIAALQERLRRLEEEAKERQLSGSPDNMAAAMKVAELKARAASLDEMVKDLTKKLLNARMDEGKASDQAEKLARQKKSMDIQMELTRRSLDLKKLRDDMASLEIGGAQARETSAAKVAAAPPVTPKPDPNASSAHFDTTDNVRLTGSELRAFKAPSPDACRNACAADAACAGYQHGRKIPVMGECRLFSSIDARDEDAQWRSGVRAAEPSSVLVPPQLLGWKPTRTEHGFQVFEGASLDGDMIKMAAADTTQSCVTVCRNTAGCIAATFLAKKGELGNMCTTLSRVTKAITGRNGASALIRK